MQNRALVAGPLAQPRSARSARRDSVPARQGQACITAGIRALSADQAQSLRVIRFQVGLLRSLPNRRWTLRLARERARRAERGDLVVPASVGATVGLPSSAAPLAWSPRLRHSESCRTSPLPRRCHDPPPAARLEGVGHAGRSDARWGEFTRLGRGESLRLLATVPVGRLIFTVNALPAVRPMNFAVVDGLIVLRTAADSMTARRVDGAIVA